MRVLLATETHFARLEPGSIWVRGPEDYRFWSAYREAFDGVEVLARVGAADGRRDLGAGWSRADGEGVKFVELDDYRGAWQYWRGLRRLRAAAAEAVGAPGAFILRAPGAVAYLAFEAIRERQARFRSPFGAEVLSDPWEALGAISHPAAPVARRWSRRQLRRVCREAGAVCYVTRARLEPLYPSGGARFACSDVRLEGVAGAAELEARRRRWVEARRGERPWRLGFVGSLEQRYKAPETHLQAVRICRARGVDLEFALLGEGRLRRDLELRAAQLGLGSSVTFLGAAPAGAAVEKFLDGLDLFVLASRTEGLPRALIEAMARGCPAIGSTAGGIPDLLEASDLVPAGDAGALAAKILEVLGDAERGERMSYRNIAKAEEFTAAALGARRRLFLGEVRRQAEAALG